MDWEPTAQEFKAFRKQCLALLRGPQDRLQTGRGDCLSDRMGAGQGEGFLGRCVVYPKAQALISRIRVPL